MPAVRNKNAYAGLFEAQHDNPVRLRNAYAGLYNNVVANPTHSKSAFVALYENVVLNPDPTTMVAWDGHFWQKVRYYEYDNSTGTWKQVLSAPDGAFDTWMGDWVAGTYDARAVVRSGGVVYRASVQTSGVPGTSPDWAVV